MYLRLNVYGNYRAKNIHVKCSENVGRLHTSMPICHTFYQSNIMPHIYVILAGHVVTNCYIYVGNNHAILISPIKPTGYEGVGGYDNLAVVGIASSSKIINSNLTSTTPDYLNNIVNLTCIGYHVVYYIYCQCSIMAITTGLYPED